MLSSRRRVRLIELNLDYFALELFGSLLLKQYLCNTITKRYDNELMFKFQLIMTNQVNFKNVEVKGYTKQEAIAQAPFQVIRDATQAWKTAGNLFQRKL